MAAEVTESDEPDVPLACPQRHLSDPRQPSQQLQLALLRKGETDSAGIVLPDVQYAARSTVSAADRLQTIVLS